MTFQARVLARIASLESEGGVVSPHGEPIFWLVFKGKPKGHPPDSREKKAIGLLRPGCSAFVCQVDSTCPLFFGVGDVFCFLWGLELFQKDTPTWPLVASKAQAGRH